MQQESPDFIKAMKEAAAAKNKKQSKVLQFLKVPGATSKGPQTTSASAGSSPRTSQDFRAHRSAATSTESVARGGPSRRSSISSWAMEAEESQKKAEAEAARAVATVAAATAPQGSATAEVVAANLGATASHTQGMTQEELNKHTEQLLRKAREESEAEKMEEDEGDFVQVLRRKPGHKPREVKELGTTLTDRSRRGETPFKDLGPGSSGQGYFTSSYIANERAKEEHLARLRRNAKEREDRDKDKSRHRRVVLTQEQLLWFEKKRCLNCGGRHIVFSCTRRRVSKEEARAMLDAAQQVTGFRPKPRPERQDRRTPAPAATTSAAAAATTSAATSTGAGNKRARDPVPTGATPAAKRSKPWNKVVKTSHLTLYVREKDGNALTEARYRSLREGFNKVILKIFRESKGSKLPPCVNDWGRTNDVVKITMATEGDRDWMRNCLSSYLVQDEQEWKLSRGRVYCGFLTDQHDPEVATLPHEDLADLIQIGRAKVKGLTAQLRLKAAPRTSRGRILQLVMDEEAEEQFHSEAGCELSVGAAGLVFFQEQGALRQEKKERKRQALERWARLHPATTGELADAAQESAERIDLIDLENEEKEEEEENSKPEGQDPLDPEEVAKSLDEQIQQMESTEDDDGEEEEEEDVEGIAELLEKQQDEAEAMVIDRENAAAASAEAMETGAVGAGGEEQAVLLGQLQSQD